MASSKPVLSKKEVLQMLSTDWHACNIADNVVKDLDEFLQKFYSNLTAQYDTEVTETHLRCQFLISKHKKQFCLFQDITSLIYNVDKSITLGNNGLKFENTCNLFSSILLEIADPDQFYSHAFFKEAFEGIGKKNPGINLFDVLIRLIKENFLILSYSQDVSVNLNQASSMQNQNANPAPIEHAHEKFMKHLEKKMPKDRVALKALFESEKDVFGLNDHLFEDVVKRLKERKFLRFESGSAKIAYLTVQQNDKKQGNGGDATGKKKFKGFEVFCQRFMECVERELPTNRKALEVLFEKENEEHGYPEIRFRDVLDKLQEKQFLKLKNGTSKIVYLNIQQQNEAKGKESPNKGGATNSQTSATEDNMVKRFKQHLISLKEAKPVDRKSLKALYEDEFMKSISNEIRGCKNLPFKDVLGKLKSHKFLRFLSGSDRIEYLLPKQTATDQHYGRRNEELKSNKKADAQIFSDKGKRKELVADRNGISITTDQEENEPDKFNGIINLGSVMQGKRLSVKVFIQFDAEDDNLTMKFTNCELVDNARNVFTIGDKHNIHQGKKELEMPSGSSYQLTVYYKSKDIGHHTCPLALSFTPKDGSQGFTILRFLHAQTGNPEIEEIMPTEPYQRIKPHQITRDPSVETVRGVPPVRRSSIVIKVPLAKYPIPGHIRGNINKGNGSIYGDAKELLEADLDMNNHKERFHSLLYFEELQWEVDVRQYDIKAAKLKKTANLFGLEVPGLAENRPSVIVGDMVFVRENTSGETTQNKEGQNANKQIVEAGIKECKKDQKANRQIVEAGIKENKKDQKANKQIVEAGVNRRIKQYEGFIHEVEGERVLLKFHQSFHDSFINGRVYHVHFSPNRGPVRLMHRALDIAHDLLDRKVFPTLKFTSDVSYPPLLSNSIVENIRVFDRKIENNLEQLRAVKKIVSGSSRPLPYVIFGPPGTGKTVTCVEAMRQVLKLLPNSRILACAPSNYAADLILHRLLNPCPIPKNQLFRLNAYSRSLHSLPQEYDIKNYCKIADGQFEMPNWKEIQKYRVIVCTMTSAGRLVSMGDVPMNHFTHIFMDECGQAMEPECLIPIAGLLNPENINGGQFVMAGDPKQLGPVLRSPVACEYGLQMSLLERLMTTSTPYQRSQPDDSHMIDDDGNIINDHDSGDLDDLDDFLASAIVDVEMKEEQEQYNERFITKLIKNYRSHPAILELPNDLFYDNELEPCADEFKTTTLCQWMWLPTKNFPVIFHGVEGQDLREGNSPSFFNPEEAVEVAKYVRTLLDEKSLGVSPDQIGVISPYRKQVAKIRKLLEKDSRRPKMSELKIGSVEEFQGSERRIIIISTVRSNKEYLKLDSKFRLGFLKNPKRFNVAITRAQALLIVVGNPFVLSEDAHWNEFLGYCIKHGGYRGCQYTEDSKDLLAEKMSKLDIGEAFKSALRGIKKFQ